MSNRADKPMLSSSQLVAKMRDEKGITFNYTSEEAAAAYLTNVNNYMRTAAYRQNYQKYTRGSNEGKYIGLDFAYLQELSTIDMHLRFIISKMCSDIEHTLKVQLIKHVVDKGSSDGYDICNNFLSQNLYILNKLNTMTTSPFTGDLINKYFTVQCSFNPAAGKNLNQITAYDDCPVWVLCELLSFGDFIRLYNFYYSGCGEQAIDPAILNLVKSLRNACAHNNCIISNLRHGASAPPREIRAAVKNIPTITTSQRQKKLSCRPMLEFVSLLYVYSRVVEGEVRYHRAQELKQLFFQRIPQKKGFFKTNNLILSNYRFACVIINEFLS
ncbi:MAG: Abi family protein [Oscillospiraceae bacterium]|nr:Abi family protein [Oscillospiraceae bacterium]